MSWVESVGKSISDSVCQFLINTLDGIIDIACIGAIGYIVFYCLLYMWFSQSKYFQKALFGGFALMLLRIFDTVIALGKQ